MWKICHIGSRSSINNMKIFLGFVGLMVVLAGIETYMSRNQKNTLRHALDDILGRRNR